MIGLFAQLRVHLPDLITVEIDGGDTLDIAAIGDLVTLQIEAVTGTAVGDHSLRGAEVSHVSQQGSDFLADTIQSDFTIQPGREGNAGLGTADGSAELFTLGQQVKQELGHQGDPVTILAVAGL